jgi:hypothetical protein
MRFTVAGSHFLNGGPVVGIGPRLDYPDLRLHFGWEFAGPAYVLYQLAGETNGSGRFTAVPSIEVATPGFFLIPSIGLGVGAPVEVVGGKPYPGARVQFELSFPFVSLAIPVDFFPTVGPPDVAQVALVIQASF